MDNLCGGQGTCGKCLVKVLKGRVSCRESALPQQAGRYLACRTHLLSDLEIALMPQMTGCSYNPMPENLAFKNYNYLQTPLVKKYFLELPPARAENNSSDSARVMRELKKVSGLNEPLIGLKLLSRMPQLIRKNQGEVTATVSPARTPLMLNIESGRKPQNYGLALDLGTTTLVGALLDLDTLEVLSLKGSYNPQLSYGEDVISRMIFAEKVRNRLILQKSALEGINRLIMETAREAGIEPDRITCLTVAANSAMLHFLYGLDTHYLRRDPYLPVTTSFSSLQARDLGVKISREGIIVSLPAVSSYLGGDLVAGVLACKMEQKNSLSLLMDLGTNGEVALGNREWLVAASCSAGPAFEGGGIKFGMRAAPGAIQKIKITAEKISCLTIGGGKPLGICGSGLIDLLAELLKNRLIDRSGKFRPQKAPHLFRETSDGPALRLVEKADSGLDEAILVWETDLENLIRAKAAMYAGCEFLLKKMGLDFNQVEEFFLGGGFGNYLEVENAVIIGLLPDLPRKKFVLAGNTSLKGSALCLASREAYEKTQEIASGITSFELSLESEFMNRYTAALFLPHTDLKAFPRVKADLGF